MAMQLEEQSRNIRLLAARHTRAQWLGAIVCNRDEIQPFAVAAMTYWAIVGGEPDLHPASPPTAPILWNRFVEFRNRCTEYVLDDPVTRMNPDVVSLWAMVRRLSASQLPFGQFPSGGFARAMCLWTSIAPRLSNVRRPKFDFPTCFESFYGLGPLEWIQVAYGLNAAGHSNHNFHREWFDRARNMGMRMPCDGQVLKALETLVATPSEYIALARKYQWSDRAFFAYDRNPLLKRPVIRPWEQKDVAATIDHMATPLPHLMGARVTGGVRDDLFEACGATFTEFFGDVFSEYVGELLRNGYSNWETFSEDDLEGLLRTEMKRPDWLTLFSENVVLWECKATKLSERSMVTGVIDEETSVRRHITKAVTQFDEFEQALHSRVAESHPLRSATHWWRVVVVSEDLYMGKTELEELLGRAPQHPTLVLPIERVEILLAVLNRGEDPMTTLTSISERGYDVTMKELFDANGSPYEWSYLRTYDKLLLESLGVP